jgi:hypothetical protein
MGLVLVDLRKDRHALEAGARSVRMPSPKLRHPASRCADLCHGPAKEASVFGQWRGLDEARTRYATIGAKIRARNEERQGGSPVSSKWPRRHPGSLGYGSIRTVCVVHSAILIINGS